jgi:hypothetical protein
MKRPNKTINSRGIEVLLGFNWAIIERQQIKIIRL